jgi:hypothetical protein
MFKMLLWYVITGEITPWMDNILTYLLDHVNNADPEPFNEHYNVGGTILVRQHIEQNKKYAPKPTISHVIT